MHWEDICTNCRKDLCEELIVRGLFGTDSRPSRKTVTILLAGAIGFVGVRVKAVLQVIEAPFLRYERLWGLSNLTSILGHLIIIRRHWLTFGSEKVSSSSN